MANNDELKRLGERFPNKNVGCGNPDAKILVVTQKEGNEDVDFKYLKRLFRDFPGPKAKDLGVLTYCYYIVYDEELLKYSFFERFQVIQYVFPDGNHLQEHDPAKLFGMKWIPECTVEDGGTQRLFMANSKTGKDKPERIMLCTYPFENVSHTIFKCSRLLMNWFFLSQKENNKLQ
jgi:hypothetical protein